jgi:transposase InsO family protein
VKYAWISDQIELYAVGVMCELLEVSRSGYYAWERRGPSSREACDAQLGEAIEAVQRQHRGRYGRRRMHQELTQGQGLRVGKGRVGRLMRERDVQCRLRRRYKVVTTDSKHDHPIAQNVLERDFQALEPDQKWVADLTYVATGQGWVYVALIMDLFSRKIVGWAMSASMPVDLTLEALKVAYGWRQAGASLVHHSDRGSQYAARAYREALGDRKVIVSMSRKGDCWDNAPMESLNGTLKVECVHPEQIQTRQQAQALILEYIQYYNTKRLHSSLGYETPAQFEKNWHAKQHGSPGQAMR